MKTLWDTNTEISFFLSALENFSTPDQLFYKLKDGYYAYIPKKYSPQGMTLQSRNSLIGSFTEKWCQNLLNPIARELGLYAINDVVCDELSLSNRSAADLAFCTTDEKQQKAENIKMIFEIKMSVVSNYKYSNNGRVEHIGDYTSHQGTPSLLRSDSMLKAIGKSINIRVASRSGNHIPIVIIGNSPITNHYTDKVDALKKAGIVQGFWSLNPKPCDGQCILESPQQSFITLRSSIEVKNICKNILTSKMSYFSGMLPKANLGKIIRIASLEPTIEKKAEKFLELLGG